MDEISDRTASGSVPAVADPVSTRIRRRLRAAHMRFNANDNIADFIEPGEHAELLDEVAEKMRAVLESLVIDTETDRSPSIVRALRGRGRRARRSPCKRPARSR